jgi:hypothetical protein
MEPIQADPRTPFLPVAPIGSKFSKKLILCVGLLGGAGVLLFVGAALASIGWDSGALLVRIIAALTGVFSLVVFLPAWGRRLAISFAILFHFAGILDALATQHGSWIAVQLWVAVFRPYLQCMGLDASYSYYSQGQGPVPLMWFCVEYEGAPGATGRCFRWIHVPDFDKARNAYTPEGVHIWSGTEITRYQTLAYSSAYGSFTPSDFYSSLRRRLESGKKQGIPLLNPEEMDYSLQYKEPCNSAKRWQQAFVRHVSRICKHPDYPDLEVVGIKLYLVEHKIIDLSQLATGDEPTDDKFYIPFYFGEFDKDGNMKPSSRKTEIKDGYYQETNRDPLLYWVIPRKYVKWHAEGRGN